jgi:hypothetical protein
MIIQTLRRPLFSLLINQHKVALDHHLTHAHPPLQRLPLTCVLGFLCPSRCFGTQIRGAHNLSNRYKSLESALRPEYLRKQGEEDQGRPTTPGEQVISSEPSQQPFLDTGVSPLQMERIMIKGKSILRPKPIIFHGIPLPPKPPPPASDGMFPFKAVCSTPSGQITP